MKPSRLSKPKNLLLPYFMAPSNNGLVRLPFKEKIAGSNPRGVTNSRWPSDFK